MPREIKKRDVAMVVATCCVLLVVLLTPALIRSKNKAARITCVSKCKQMGLAFRIYANDNHNLYPMQVGVEDGGAREDILQGRVFRVFQVISNELSTPWTVVCPTDTRKIAADFDTMTNTNVSYFVGLDAEDMRPNMVLTGDRNLGDSTTSEPATVLYSGIRDLGTNPLHIAFSEAMHDRSGNIGLADGSVQQVTRQLLFQQLRNSGDRTNRLVFPQ